MYHKTLSINDAQIKFASADTRRFGGYASTFNGLDSYGDTILPGAFKQALKDLRGKGRTPKMFENHRMWTLPIGKWLSVKEDDHGLIVEGELTPGHPQADVVGAAMRHETVDGLSIGFMMGPDDFEVVQDGKQRVIKNISELIEISVVTFPADDGARLSALKSALDGVDDEHQFIAFLQDAGGFNPGLAAVAAARAKAIFTRMRADGDDANAATDLARIVQQAQASLAMLRQSIR